RKFMKKYEIPQPEFAVFESVDDGIAYLQNQPDQSWFVKASGLAEGKGALPAANNAEAEERIVELQKFGDAGKTYLLEKWLKSEDGSNAEEFSAFALSDGNSWQHIGFVQDHKRALDGDKGENTGGMGVSTPPLVITENVKKQTEEIFSKTFEGMKKEGRAYKGVLYLGGILVGGKVYVVEYNARWGDPEVEVLLPGITKDYFDIVSVITQQGLHTIVITTDGKARVGVCGSAKGYPGDYSGVKGKKITGLENAKNVVVYGAGIKKDGSNFVVNGGRVFYVIGEGKDVLEARNKAYDALESISIEGENLYYRKDIGWRDVQRLTSNNKNAS
ncbi:MAG: phosphoribosylamine--glycine ligase, partial [Patescibacteria group bacterium]|nr:phosphoribosylamine--glycine ligase [Patescibacteria group bacterium]